MTTLALSISDATVWSVTYGFVIYDGNMFIIQATGVAIWLPLDTFAMLSSNVNAS
jgi:hypothetical protein